MERPDKLRIEALDAMERGEGWDAFRDRVIEMRTSANADVLGATSWESFLEARKALVTIDRILDIPYILRQEAKSAPGS